MLNIQKNRWYVDCNLGGGGHTELILKSGGKVIGVDLDADAIREVARNHGLTVSDTGEHLVAYSDDLILYQSNFALLDRVIADLKTTYKEFIKNPPQIMGVFFDLGVSTFQLEEAERGFSFNKDAPLDMRMDQSQGVNAKDLVNGLYEKELAELFMKFGEENFSKPIARKIVEYRKTKLIETTDELAKIVLSVRRRTPTDRTHPATRVFQALRIVVNDELNALKEALPRALEILSKNGRLAVISFHSLEDRIVKNCFREWEDEGTVNLITKKPVETSEVESTDNPRARSAKLRGLEKIN